jgi:excisionase family DNA binding protein
MANSYLSLKEAAKLSGYHPDYLSYLLRKKKIKGEKIGRDWVVTESALKEYLLGKKFLPLEKILFSKFSFKKILFSFIFVLLILFFAILIFTPFSFQKEKGDFELSKIKTEKLGPVEASSFVTEGGDIEISIKPNNK